MTHHISKAIADHRDKIIGHTASLLRIFHSRSTDDSEQTLKILCRHFDDLLREKIATNGDAVRNYELIEKHGYSVYCWIGDDMLSPVHDHA